MRKGGQFTYNYTLPNVNVFKISPIKKSCRDLQTALPDLKRNASSVLVVQADVLRTVTKPGFEQKLKIALETLHDKESKIMLQRAGCKRFTNRKCSTALYMLQ